MSLQNQTLEITDLRYEVLQAFNNKARQFGKTSEQYARDLIEKEVASDEQTSEMSFQADQQEIETWRREWRALAEAVSVAVPDGPSLVDSLIEMRR